MKAKKQCTKCKIVKPISGFYKSKRNKDGLGTWCRDCCRAWQKKHRKTCSNDPVFITRRRKYALEYYDKQHKTLSGYLRHAFHKMKTRCNNPEAESYEFYGGRGIKCLFKNADEFIDHVIDDLGFNTLEKLEGLLLDRINLLDHFTPGNIRFVTPSQNARSNRKQRTGPLGECTSQFKGVSYDKKRNKWKAYIRVKGKYAHLGRFDNEEDAGRAYDAAALKFFGEFAMTNEMLGLLNE